MLLAVSVFWLFLLIAVVFEFDGVLVHSFSVSSVSWISSTVSPFVIFILVLVSACLVVSLFISVLILKMVFVLVRLVSWGCP